MVTEVCPSCGFYLKKKDKYCKNCSIKQKTKKPFPVSSIKYEEIKKNINIYYRLHPNQYSLRLGSRLLLISEVLLAILGLYLMAATEIKWYLILIVGFIIISTMEFYRTDRNTNINERAYRGRNKNFIQKWLNSLLGIEQSLNYKLKETNDKRQSITQQLLKLGREKDTTERRRIIKGLEIGKGILTKKIGELKILLYQVYLTRINNNMKYYLDTINILTTIDNFDKRIKLIEDSIREIDTYVREWNQEVTSEMKDTNILEFFNKFREEFNELRERLVNQRAITSIQGITILPSDDQDALKDKVDSQEEINEAIGDTLESNLVLDLEIFWDKYNSINRELNRIEFEEYAMKNPDYLES